MSSGDTSTQYRPDVDGLRAIAVVSVVLYHAGISQIPGGFAGVDIFFVISGYLITGLILRDINVKDFSIVAFYGRRARRILPALFVVLFVSSLAAYKLLLPPDLSHFGSSLLAVLFFGSNIFFSQTTDYFAPSAEITPLLHMWSLSVEEQFYILYPLLLLFATRKAPTHVVDILGGLCVLSIGWNIHNISAPHDTFYSTIARAWELLLGGLVATGWFDSKVNQRWSALLGLAGIALIAYAVLVPSPQSASYVYATFSACLGTACVLQSGRVGQNLASKALALPPIVFIGLISYSLYLWHWVLLVFARFYLVYPLTPSQAWTTVLGSVLLAILSWAFVETPVRKIKSIRLRRLFLGLALICCCILVGFSDFIHRTRGIPSRFNGAMEVIAAGAQDKWKRWDECKYQFCHVGPVGEKESFIMWGDSHVGALAPAMEKLAESHHMAGYIVSNPSCPPVIGLENFELPSGCPALAQKTLSFIQSHNIHTILIHASWGAYTKNRLYNPVKTPLSSPVDYDARLRTFDRQMRITMQELTKLHMRIILITSVPLAKTSVPTALAQAFSLTGSTDVSGIMYSYADFIHREAFALSELRSMAKDYSAEIVYPHELLCDAQTCRAAQGMIPLYMDEQHMTVHGAMFLLPMLERLFPPNQSAGSALTH